MPRSLPGDRPWTMPGRQVELSENMWEAVLACPSEDKRMDLEIMLIDNSSESYRDLKEGSLFIQRAAHQVRPPADTGIDYSFNETDREFEVNLIISPQLSEDGCDSLRLETAHNLCRACLDVFNYYCRYVEARSAHQKRSRDRSSGPPLSNSVVHHFNMYSLWGWANVYKCYLCQMLLYNVEQIYGKELNPANYESFRTEICWSRSVTLGEKDTLYFVITNPSCTRDQWNFSHFFRMEVWPAQSLPRHFDIPAGIGSSETSRVSLENQTGTRSANSRALAVSWLSQCRANEAGKHQECNKRNWDYLPTRLLDVKNAQETSQVRLVYPASIPAPFAEDREWMTLSHCWGAWGAEEDPVLTKSNLEERQGTGLNMADLPKTFQDALEIAGWFDIKWLWIDCLCIIQDSPSDWRQEAMLMSQIYQNAVLNVSADSGEDSRVGCFVERNELDITPLGIHGLQLSQSWDVIPTAQFLYDWVAQSPSFSRAWIYRERQLSRRVLHFTDKELIWECCGTEGTSFASEMLPGGAPFKHGLFKFDHKYQIGRLQQGLIQGAEETYATWNDICENISEKYLTKPSDMPIILSGLARDFAQMLPADEYVAGLWRSTLPYSLLWHIRGFKPDNVEYIAPSWSWLSAGRAVTLANRCSITKKQPLTTVLSISEHTKYQEAYALDESSTLELEGILRRIQLSFALGTNIFELSVLDDEDEDEELRAIGSSWDDYNGDMCTLELDAPSEVPDLGCYCLFITTQQSSSGQRGEREIGCLLLERVTDEGCNFRRIGILVLKDLFALKMRYRVYVDAAEGVCEEAKVDIEDLWKGLQRIIGSIQDDAVRAERKQSEELDEGQNGDDPEYATGDTTLVSAREQPHGLDALYEFDETIRDMRYYEKLSPQVFTIV